MTEIKRGDRVRATLGESVVVGKVTYTSPSGYSVHVGDEPMAQVAVHCSAGWTVELVPEPEPPVGTVLLDRVGDAWVRGRDGQWRCAVPSGTAKCDSLSDFADWGPFTVLAPEWKP